MCCYTAVVLLYFTGINILKPCSLQLCTFTVHSFVFHLPINALRISVNLYFLQCIHPSSYVSIYPSILCVHLFIHPCLFIHPYFSPSFQPYVRWFHVYFSLKTLQYKFGEKEDFAYFLTFAFKTL